MRYRERAKLDKIREKYISKYFYFYNYCDFQNNYNLKDYLLLENCAIAIEQNLTKLEKTRLKVLELAKLTLHAYGFSTVA